MVRVCVVCVWCVCVVCVWRVCGMCVCGVYENVCVCVLAPFPYSVAYSVQ